MLNKRALFLITHTRARARVRTHTHSHCTSTGIPAIAPRPCSPLPCGTQLCSEPRASSRPRPRLPRWPRPTPLWRRHLPCSELRQTRDSGCSEGKGSQDKPKEKEKSNRVWDGSFTFHNKGKCCAPCTWLLRSCLWFRKKHTAAERAAAGVESCGRFPPAARASILSCPRCSLDSYPGLRDPAGPRRFPPEAGLSCHMHLRNPSSCAKKSPRS